MKDLTKGSISSHLIAMAVPMAAGMIFQTLYFFVDLYFVAKLGDAAVAGVSTAGNAMFIIMALTQVLGVGTVALIAHAVGRKDQADANLIFNQSLLIAALCGVLTLVLGYTGSLAYVQVDRRGRGHGTGRRYISILVPARHGVAVRDGGDGLGAARHRHREADDGRASAHARDQHDPRADPDRGLGHRPPDGRRRRRSREHDRDRRRRDSAVPLLRATREVRLLPQGAVATARRSVEAHAHGGLAGRRRVRVDVPLHRRHVLGASQLRRGCAGRHSASADASCRASSCR